ncbi:MAG: cyclic nucleotide-binding domain-containing protein [Alphaproteobacteria bacterium]|nr:cyclic nucleotide-binding domain-containing protein [Alphaproteobacteria bacterium]
MRFEVAGASETGVRDNNEDAWRVLPEHGVFALADGMGGLEHGEVMSAAATESVVVAAPDLARLARQVGGDSGNEARRALFNRMVTMFTDTSQRLFEHAEQAGARMGTTLTTVVLTADRMVIGHVGDCRVIRVRKGTVTALTTDHSVAAAQLRRGRITLEEYKRSPKRAMLYQSLGPMPEAEADIVEAELAEGDVYVIACDGVWGVLEDEDLVELAGEGHVEDAAQAICRRAMDRGSDDNCTCIVVRIHDMGPGQPAGLIRSLQVSPLFRGYAEQDLRLLAPFLSTRDLLEGDVIVREGEYGTEMYVIVSGAVEVTRRGIPLAQLGPGAHFGQLSLVSEASRTASAVASFPTRLLVLHKDGVQSMCQRRPELATRFLLTLLGDTAERLVAFTNRIGRAEAAMWQD